MPNTLTIETQVIGARQPVPAWVVAYPTEWQVGGETLPLSDLISRVVREEVEAFNERQEARALARALTGEEIAAAAATGRVDMGGRPATKAAVDAAIKTALQAFEDGMYLVFVDGEQVAALDAPVFVRPQTHLRFVRLVMLAGG
jgi:hypothetical protein